jgi:hypothetical protein
MASLPKRIKILEAVLQAASFRSVSATEVDRLALGKLSAVDRNLIQQARTRSTIGIFIESHAEVWQRWDAALGEAMRELDYPIRFHANDWDL